MSFSSFFSKYSIKRLAKIGEGIPHSQPCFLPIKRRDIVTISQRVFVRFAKFECQSRRHPEDQKCSINKCLFLDCSRDEQDMRRHRRVPRRGRTPAPRRAGGVETKNNLVRPRRPRRSPAPRRRLPGPRPVSSLVEHNTWT